jgi:hypothetical protein
LNLSTIHASRPAGASVRLYAIVCGRVARGRSPRTRGTRGIRAEPKPRRAKLLRPTEKGREALRTISVAQKAWSDAIGAEVGGRNLKQASALVDRIQRAVSAHGLPGE